MGGEGAGSSCGGQFLTSPWQWALPWALAGHIFTGSLRNFKCRPRGAGSVDVEVEGWGQPGFSLVSGWLRNSWGYVDRF